MECRSCSTSFFDDTEWKSIKINGPGPTVSAWTLYTVVCPSCHDPTISLGRYKGGQVDPRSGRKFAKVIYPQQPTARQIDPAVPDNLRQDYLEACAVLPISPKASAALARRVLQEMLGEQGYKQRNLADQIEAMLSEQDRTKILPSAIREVVDAIRNVGNFAAHAITDKTTLQVIDVEPVEAEWCLEIIEGLFDEYYVKPDASKKKLQELNDKLDQAGKPPARS